MTREDIYDACLQAMKESNCLLLESATGTGKSKISIDLVNNLCNSKLKDKHVKMLLLVAKKVHKQTWKEEFEKWGGINVQEVVTECYESLHKHLHKHFDLIVADEIHHIGSEKRLKELRKLKFDYLIGLSATIPNNLKLHFRYHYHAKTVSCDLIEAIEDDILPEPTILLFPLQVENTRLSETIEFHTDAKGPVIYGTIADYWKLKKQKNAHSIIRCTQKQKLIDINRDIDYYKSIGKEKIWLNLCGKRLEFLADCKLPWIKLILQHLDKERTVTFCKTIAQTEQLGKNCIHSQNKGAEKIYNDFNAGKINHITTVNILNENANLVNCRYGIFCNITSSEITTQQRQGRMLRHKDPVMIIPFYKGTREEELVMKAIGGFDKVKTINSISEI